MLLSRLRIAGLRCLSEVEIEPGAGLNMLVGGNGAGKTSVLEALYLLGSGKSFRGGGHDAVIAHGRSALQVYAEVEAAGRVERVGLERGRSEWRALRNGMRVADLAELAALVPVVCFSPESHQLIAGPSEVRRRFLDWLVFHVEPGFADAHRRYSRLLRQRNALLKQAPSAAELAAWTRNLADAGEQLAAHRDAVFPRFAERMSRMLAELLPEMGAASLRFKRGWRDGLGLYERLLMAEGRERELGYTLAGPHRADWLLLMDGHEIREHGSRGQQKLVALAAVLVAAGLFRELRGFAPIVALDDLASELDAEHQSRALLECAALQAQLWVTGTQASAATQSWTGEIKRFHVEQGRISAAQ